MSAQSTDRNLLLGILALQTDCITHAQLIAAMQAWVFEKSQPLESILLKQQSINEATRAFLSEIVARHIELHRETPSSPLAALSSIEFLYDSLAKLNDPEIDQSLRQSAETRKLESAGSGADFESTRIHLKDDGQVQRFRILRPHAKGGLGQVSVAEDTELHREVALKELQDRFRRDDASRARFVMEGEVTGQLEHPGIVPVYSLGKTATGSPFYVMRLIRGDSLKDAISRLHQPTGRTVDPAEKRQLLHKLVRRLVDVCNAIEYAHSRGVLHRDLKPGNIMLGKYGETLVVDWGLAKPIGRKGHHDRSEEATVMPSSGDGSSETGMGTVVGTLAYMSPEQADGNLVMLGPESDVYCLGATLYHILTGRPPVEKAPTEEMLAAIRTGRISRPTSIDPSIPKALEAIALKALALRREDRYPTAAGLGADLELWLADEPVSVYREPWSLRAVRWVKRHRTLSASVASSTTLAAIALAIGATLIARQNSTLKAKNEEIARAQVQIAKQNDFLSNDRAALLGMLDAAEVQLSQSNDLSAFRSEVMEKSYETFLAMHQGDPEDARIALVLARSARLSGNQIARTSRRTLAVDRLKQSVSLQEKFLPADVNSLAARNYLAETYRDLGTNTRAVAQLAEAREAFEKAGVLTAQVLIEKPESLPYQRNAALLQLVQAGLCDELGDYETGATLAARSAKFFLDLEQRPEKNAKDHVQAMLAAAWQGRLLDQLGRHVEARDVFSSVIARGAVWHQKLPSDRDTTYPYARLLHWDADGASLAGTITDDQITKLDEAIGLNRMLATSPASPGSIFNHGDALKTRARIHRMKSQLDEALKSLTESEKNLRALVKTVDLAGNRQILSETLAEKAETLFAKGDSAAALEGLKEAIDLLASAAKMSPLNPSMPRNRLTLEKRLAEMANR